MTFRAMAIWIMTWTSIALIGPAVACSPATGFRPYTNLELVQHAPTIVIGRITRWDYRKPPEETWYLDTSLLVEPILTLKGNGPAGPFRLNGMLAIPQGYGLAGAGEPSHFDEFFSPHVDAFTGACLRENFVVGQLVVFFMGVSDGQWEPSGRPFARWAEDVPSVDGPWVKLVQIYINAAELPRSKRRALLRREQAKLLAGGGDRISRLMAADIQRQIKGVSFWDR